MTDLELAARLRALADFIDLDVSGQRYGQFGSPFVNTALLYLAAERLEQLVDDGMDRLTLD